MNAESGGPSEHGVKQECRKAGAANKEDTTGAEAPSRATGSRGWPGKAHLVVALMYSGNQRPPTKSSFSSVSCQGRP